MKDFILPFEFFLFLNEERLKEIHKRHGLGKLQKSILTKINYVGDNWEEYLKQRFTFEYIEEHMEKKYSKYSKKKLVKNIIDLTSDKIFETFVLEYLQKVFG